HFGKKALGIVMTGMGADGKEGARLLKSAGGHMWTQDEASCVIYGMPMAIVDAGYSDAVVNLRDLANEMERINR
ncbi:MAG: chemotaxis protein CheB, partial [Oceanobacter sp.]